jgi:hypothetical protein
VGGANILLGAVAAALIVLSGALYALFFALARLRESPGLGAMAWAAYAALVVCTGLLVRSLSLGGAWLIVIAVMLIGYLAAPYAIWHLSVGTHAPAPTRVRHE